MAAIIQSPWRGSTRPIQNGSASGWTVWQSYGELLATFFYLTDRKAAA
jgi:hypothetical protein